MPGCHAGPVNCLRRLRSGGCPERRRRAVTLSDPFPRPAHTLGASGGAEHAGWGGQGWSCDATDPTVPGRRRSVGRPRRWPFAARSAHPLVCGSCGTEMTSSSWIRSHLLIRKQNMAHADMMHVPHRPAFPALPKPNTHSTTSVLETCPFSTVGCHRTGPVGSNGLAWVEGGTILHAITSGARAQCAPVPTLTRWTFPRAREP